MKERENRRLTMDHFTPRCIATLLGWSRIEIQGLNPLRYGVQIQYLTQKEHSDKDKTTESELVWAKKGGGKPLWSHCNEILIFENKKVGHNSTFLETKRS